MGLFETVHIKARCPKCRDLLSDIQTKDGPQELGHIKEGVRYKWLKKLRWIDAIAQCRVCSVPAKKCKCCGVLGEPVPYWVRMEIDVEDGKITGNWRDV